MAKTATSYSLLGQSMDGVIKTSTTVLREPLGLLGLSSSTISGEGRAVEQPESRSRDESSVRTEVAGHVGLVSFPIIWTAQGELKVANSGTVNNEPHKYISWNFYCLAG